MTHKTRCSKCQRVFFTLTAHRDGRRSLEVPAYGISMVPVDPTRLTYLLTCTKCGHREVHVVPVEPPLQSPTHSPGQANALTGGLAFTPLPDNTDDTNTTNDPAS